MLSNVAAKTKPKNSRILLLLTAAGFAVSAILLAGCTAMPEVDRGISPYGRGRVRLALQPPQVRKRIEAPQSGGIPHPDRQHSAGNGLSPGQESPGRPFALTLADGNVLEGLFFPHPDGVAAAKPLLMAGFGFLQDRWGAAANEFYRAHLQAPEARIDAHVLILDHPSAAPYLAANGMLSIGAYDEARMWIEVGQHLHRYLQIDGLHLFGIGVSGLSVLHALIEDRRLGLRLFDSGVALSPVSDLRRYPARALSLFEPPPDLENPWDTFRSRFRRTSLAERRQKQIMETLLVNEFIPHYRQINPGHTRFELPREKIPVFFHKAFENRLTVLREQQSRTHPWNAEFSRRDLNAFMRSTRIAVLIDRIRTPLVLLHAAGDPIASQSDFTGIARIAEGNPWIISELAESGLHAGYTSVYGRDYLQNLLEVMQDPDVLRNWRAEIYTDAQ